MLGIKKQLIKNMIKLEVVSNTPGKLKIYVAQLKKIDDDYKHYEFYAQNAIGLLKGIKDLDVDYMSGVATINYDPDIVNAQQIYRWLQVMIDIGIDYYDELKAIWQQEGDEDQKVEEIWQRIRPVLLKALNGGR